MLAGAAGIDLALLVVAADDGVMPQTREHLADPRPARLVARRRRADQDRPRRRRRAPSTVAARRSRALLAGDRRSPARAIFPVSALTGAGIDGLRARLLARGRAQAARGARPSGALPPRRRPLLHAAGRRHRRHRHASSPARVRGRRPVLLLPVGPARAGARHPRAEPRRRERAGPASAARSTSPAPASRKEAIGRGDWVLDAGAAGADATALDVALHLLAGERAAAAPLDAGAAAPRRGPGHGARRAAGAGDARARRGRALAQLVLDRAAAAAARRPLRAARPIGAAHHRRRPRARSARARAPPAHARRGLLRSGRSPCRIAARRCAAVPSEPPHLLSRACAAGDWGLAEQGLAALVPDAVTTAGGHVAMPAEPRRAGDGGRRGTFGVPRAATRRAGHDGGGAAPRAAHAPAAPGLCRAARASPGRWRRRAVGAPAARSRASRRHGGGGATGLGRHPPAARRHAAPAAAAARAGRRDRRGRDVVAQALQGLRPRRAGDRGSARSLFPARGAAGHGGNCA